MREEDLLCHWTNRYMHMKEASFSGISANPRLERTCAYRAITSVNELGGLAGPGWLNSTLTGGKSGPIKSSLSRSPVIAMWR